MWKFEKPEMPEKRYFMFVFTESAGPWFSFLFCLRGFSWSDSLGAKPLLETDVLTNKLWAQVLDL